MMPLIPGGPNTWFVDAAGLETRFCHVKLHDINTKKHTHKKTKLWNLPTDKEEEAKVFVLNCELCNRVEKICGVANSVY